ncbi:MAG: SusC/RagA family TonB-linked outer membrane protein [Chryseobacterium sp.]|jgi:iron complex outermembrane receptor protein|uniref:SusC/RagA family TonB-linked outer membrane protein n=1 Tax=Chryseobacterium sp. TaxID=1871047 RepID=UPI002819CE5D|nr:SusC/RagA family TonB-linked outer membrane protein [Chryseobacterium sp.]MDR2236449.1 SusC/RagA family TonB-linked outer membrane protein [Chryseobacterium sp.]
MKKTIISIVLLVSIGTPALHYGQNRAASATQQKTNRVPISKVLDKLSKTSKIQFLYSSSDFKDVFIDENSINYSSLEQSLNYLKKNYPLEYEIRNNTVILRKTASRKTIAQTAPDSFSAADTLAIKEKKIDEVVIIGYGKVKKSDATGSLTTVKIDSENDGSPVSAQDALAGKAAGVNIISPGGSPGAGSTIRIRGGSSLSASNDPLIVIDGIAIDNSSTSGSSNILGMINPNDIESYTVLKDASSTAIYGSRASNGVIIITTKKGTKKTRYQYSSSTKVSYNPKMLDVLSADEYRSFMKNQYAGNAGIINGLGTASTDWQKEIYRTAVSNDQNFSMTGAVKEIPYRLSLGYTNQEGIIRKNAYERMNMSLALNPSFFDKHLNINLNYKPSIENNDFISNPASGAASFDPTRPVYSNASSYGLGYFIWTDASGKPITQAGANPVSVLDLRKDQSKVFRQIGNIQMDYKIHGFEDLKLNLNAGFDMLKSDGDVFVPDNSPLSWTSIGNDGQGLQEEYSQQKKNLQLDLYADYNKSIGNHKLNVMGGYSWQRFWKSYDDRQTNLTGAKIYRDIVTKSEYYLVSFYGRLNYSFKDRYLFTATLRNDGSSRFSKDNHWGLFPSAAFAWKINEESFLKDKNIFSDLKLRLSYGKTGQQDIGGDYEWMQTYTLSQSNAMYQFGNQFYQTIRPNGYDPNLKWETTSTYNIGLDFGILKNRVSGTVEVYKRTTDDLLNKISVAAGSNLTNMIFTNIGSMENKGVELTLNTIPVKTGNWQWNLDMNLSFNKSEITKLTLVDSPDYGVNIGNVSGATAGTIQIHSIGYSPYTFYLYQQEYDADGRPIEGKYKGGLVKDKSPMPKSYLGISSKVSYKNWYLGFNGHANFGNYVYNNVKSKDYKSKTNPTTGTYSNILSYTAEQGFENLQLYSDFFLEKASFFRMDNITLGHNFKNISEKFDLGINVSMQNVFVITKYSGLDPEVYLGIDNNIYSRPRSFLFGLNVNFK